MHPDADAHAGAAALASARAALDLGRRVVVLTGAGVSTDSGIPDFRGPNGVWTKNPAAERASTLQHYLAEPETRRAAWQQRLSSPAFAAEPNGAHRALVELERSGRLDTLVTQNIDGLHQRAGSDPARVLEVHGTAWFTRCWQCGDRRPMVEALDRVRAGEDDPSCRLCGGILKSDTISFGQALVPETIDAAMAAARRADVLLAAGSTLSVYPVADMVPLAGRAGATVIVANGEPTAMDHLAHVVLRRPLGEILPAICAGLDPIANPDQSGRVSP